MKSLLRRARNRPFPKSRPSAAIGTDYNILMIARLREEAREGRSPREAAGLALRHAGPTVAAAGFILAATFATMMPAGNALLTEMGFAVSFGTAIAAVN